MDFCNSETDISDLDLTEIKTPRKSPRKIQSPQPRSRKRKSSIDTSKLENIIFETRNEILRNEPDINMILTDKISLSDRAYLLQLYEMYKMTEPSTEQWLDQRTRLIKGIEEGKKNFIQYEKYTKEQHDEMEKKEKELDGFSMSYDMKYKILQLETSLENKKIIYNRYKELQIMNSNDDEKGKLKNWLTWAVGIPHDKVKTFPFGKNDLTQFLLKVSSTLDKELYGMKTVKEQILLFVSSKMSNPNMKKCSLGLVGHPGTGKTHISRLLAKVLDFPFEQISFGGISNPDFLKGHEYTYIGAQPGEITKCLKRMGYKNGILFFDEFEKISGNKEICSALLHITDPMQNSEFKDNFLSEITIDLSYIWFVYSMNNLPDDSALRDRIFTIEVPGYTLDDKIRIVIDYLFPTALKNLGLEKDSIVLNNEIATYLIRKTTKEEDLGVRNVENVVYTIVNKLNFIVKHQNKNGKLEGFNMSFDLCKKIAYPISLKKEMIDLFFE
jgi:ATP-dependent Lon protease